jgi:hypothetical protein
MSAAGQAGRGRIIARKPWQEAAFPLHGTATLAGYRLLAAGKRGAAGARSLERQRIAGTGA